MFRGSTLLKLAGVIVFALVAGLGSAWWALLGGVRAAGVEVGPWVTSTVIGSPASDPYTRAQVALTGLLALEKSEAVYYTAARDDEGKALRGECDYRVTGRSFPARWWSITAYGADSYLMDNPADRYSYNAESLGLRFAPTAKWEINVSAEPQDANWLPVAEDAFFSLTLRLYNPAEALITNPEGLKAPSITRLSCRGGGEAAS